jgi:hypothetical protein
MFQPSTCFEQYYAHHQEVKLYVYSIWYRYSVSGRGGRTVHSLRECTTVLSQPVYCTTTTTTQRVTIPYAVYLEFDLLMMSIILLETCRGLKHYMNKGICVLIW